MNDEASPTCPECREFCTGNRIYKLYFNFSQNQSILEEAREKMKEKEKEIEGLSKIIKEKEALVTQCNKKLDEVGRTITEILADRDVEAANLRRTQKHLEKTVSDQSTKIANLEKLARGLNILLGNQDDQIEQLSLKNAELQQEVDDAQSGNRALRRQAAFFQEQVEEETPKETRSPTCPECREFCTGNRIYKLYINFSQNHSILEEAREKTKEKENEIERLNKIIKEKEARVKKCNKKLDEVGRTITEILADRDVEAATLRRTQKELEKKISDQSTKISNLEKLARGLNILLGNQDDQIEQLNLKNAELQREVDDAQSGNRALRRQAAFFQEQVEEETPKETRKSTSEAASEAVEVENPSDGSNSELKIIEELEEIRKLRSSHPSILQHPSGKSFICGQCLFSAPSREKILDHVRGIHELQPWECPRCRTKFTRLANVKRHIVQCTVGLQLVSEYLELAHRKRPEAAILKDVQELFDRR